MTNMQLTAGHDSLGHLIAQFESRNAHSHASSWNAWGLDLLHRMYAITAQNVLELCEVTRLGLICLLQTQQIAVAIATSALLSGWKVRSPPSAGQLMSGFR